MFNSYFTAGQQLAIALAVTLALVSIALHLRHKDRWALAVLTAAAVISVLPILFIFVTLQRWVVQAVVMSGLKG